MNKSELEKLKDRMVKQIEAYNQQLDKFKELFKTINEATKNFIRVVKEFENEMEER